ncbi:zf-HC2 domain-containing protein [Streptomyces sp. NPDC005423]|uniref:anti-sigma factor family protein n=1 Tax=Streptomyces sp. NPDC005423 TaxID=3155343 RepID=UPI0033AF0CDE
MSGSRPTPAEQHLGDRLSALVDGELGHESRERVLAHLATCAKCKAEADAQRRLKNVFAEVAPPPPSESFLARLQGLPGGGDGNDGGSPDGRAFATPLPGRGEPGLFGMRRGEPFAFGYAPAAPHSPAAALRPSADRGGFRIHDVGRHDPDRSASRGMRFAFVAVGAVSLAAIALGGVTANVPTGAAPDARGASGNVTPAGTQGSGAATTPESLRRRGTGPLLAQGRSRRSMPGGTPEVPTSVSAPLLPGLPSPSTGPVDEVMHTLTTPVVAGAVAMSPLIRPLTATPPVALTSWSAAPEVMAPGRLTATAPVATSSATPSPSAPTGRAR